MAYPQAFCRDCHDELSPTGTRKAAEEARAAHQDTTRKRFGREHRVAIYESAEARAAHIKGREW